MTELWSMNLGGMRIGFAPNCMFDDLDIFDEPDNLTLAPPTMPDKLLPSGIRSQPMVTSLVGDSTFVAKTEKTISCFEYWVNRRISQDSADSPYLDQITSNRLQNFSRTPTLSELNSEESLGILESLANFTTNPFAQQTVPQQNSTYPPSPSMNLNEEMRGAKSFSLQSMVEDLATPESNLTKNCSTEYNHEGGMPVTNTLGSDNLRGVSYCLPDQYAWKSENMTPADLSAAAHGNEDDSIMVGMVEDESTLLELNKSLTENNDDDEIGLNFPESGESELRFLFDDGLMGCVGGSNKRKLEEEDLWPADYHNKILRNMQDESGGVSDDEPHDDGFLSSDGEEPSFEQGRLCPIEILPEYFWESSTTIHHGGAKSKQASSPSAPITGRVLGANTCTLSDNKVGTSSSTISLVGVSGEVMRTRRSDGTDLTPNPNKLLHIGMAMKYVLDRIHGLMPTCELPINDRLRSRRERNKLASRACRLKKKAHHEANKIKLHALELEFANLETFLITLKKELIVRSIRSDLNDGCLVKKMCSLSESTANGL